MKHSSQTRGTEINIGIENKRGGAGDYMNNRSVGDSDMHQRLKRRSKLRAPTPRGNSMSDQAARSTATQLPPRRALSNNVVQANRWTGCSRSDSTTGPTSPRSKFENSRRERWDGGQPALPHPGDAHAGIHACVLSSAWLWCGHGHGAASRITPCVGAGGREGCSRCDLASRLVARGLGLGATEV